MVLTAGALSAALAGAGAIGAVFFGPLAANADTTPNPSGTSNAAPGAGTATPKSNEEATHETGESQPQETAENNGTARHGAGAHGAPNEDPAHEKTESADREKQEDANKAANPATPASPSPSAQ